MFDFYLSPHMNSNDRCRFMKRSKKLILYKVLLLTKCLKSTTWSTSLSSFFVLSGCLFASPTFPRPRSISGLYFLRIFNAQWYNTQLHQNIYVNDHGATCGRSLSKHWRERSRICKFSRNLPIVVFPKSFGTTTTSTPVSLSHFLKMNQILC